VLRFSRTIHLLTMHLHNILGMLHIFKAHIYVSSCVNIARLSLVTTRVILLLPKMVEDVYNFFYFKGRTFLCRCPPSSKARHRLIKTAYEFPLEFLAGLVYIVRPITTLANFGCATNYVVLSSWIYMSLSCLLAPQTYWNNDHSVSWLHQRMSYGDHGKQPTS